MNDERPNLAEGVVHTLHALEVTYIHNWAAWKALWEQMRCAEILHSLLHFGFDVPADSAGDTRERIRFYLDIADGHGDAMEWSARGGIEHRVYSSVFGQNASHTALRPFIAHKAFAILAQRCFRDQNADERGRDPSWVEDMVVPETLDRILDFFQPRSMWGIRNLDEGNTRRDAPVAAIARQFLLDLCKLAWKFRSLGERETAEDAEIRDMFRVRRPRFVRLLWGLKRLDLLLTDDYEADDACLEALEELALGEDLYLPSPPHYCQKHRRPASIAEAILGKSEPARILLVLRTRNAERARFNRLRDLAMQRAETERTMSELGAATNG